jgi:cell wall-associated NlpC family hydrolase
MTNVTDWIGLNFSWYGTGPQYDCWTLVQAYLREQGIELPDYRYPAEDVDPIGAIALSAIEGDAWEEHNFPGRHDVVMMGRSAYPLHHAGVMVTDQDVLHILPRSGSVIESIDRLRTVSPFRVMRFFRWVG